MSDAIERLISKTAEEVYAFESGKYTTVGKSHDEVLCLILRELATATRVQGARDALRIAANKRCPICDGDFRNREKDEVSRRHIAGLWHHAAPLLADSHMKCSAQEERDLLALPDAELLRLLGVDDGQG